MRVLIVPLPALAKTNGPQLRVGQLVKAFREKGINVATCAALDMNFKPFKDVPNYFLEVPIPLGLPPFIGRHLFKVASITGMTSRKSVASFEEVLFLTGALEQGYFFKNVKCVQEAIHEYKPDIVYSEFNLGTIAAAKIEKVKVVTNFSYPVQYQYAMSPQFSKGVRKALKSLGLPQVRSALEIFDWADYKIVPSSCTLEPIPGGNVLFTGPFHPCQPAADKSGVRDKIVAYMGMGTISSQKLLKELKEAFIGSDYKVYIAGEGLKGRSEDNIFIAQQFDFNQLLPSATCYIHHGGQNSVMDALRYGVPQLICPGKVFERKYNAQSIVKEQAGIMIEEKDFVGRRIKAAVANLQATPIYRAQSQKIWQGIEMLGGAEKIIDLFEKWV